MIDKDHPLPVTHQARLLDLSRSSVYYHPVPMSVGELALMAAIDEIHMKRPFYGIRRIRGQLLERGFDVGRQHVATLMRTMGIEAIAPKRKTSAPHPGHRIYPYLLRGLDITRAGHVWCADVTYLPMARGFCYLVAVMDWASRRVLSEAGLQHARRGLLHRSPRRGARPLRNARDLQHRPRFAVHLGGLHEPAVRSRRGDLDGCR